MTAVCPDCRKPLGGEYCNGVHIDVCATCQGIWCDAGEISEIRKPLLSSRTVPDVEQGPFQVQALRALGCPRCTDDTLAMGTVKGYRVARCMECRGVWLPGKTVISADLRSAMWEAGAALVEILTVASCD